MSKQVMFKVKKQEGSELIIYPDELCFFTNVIGDTDGYIHAEYTGSKKLQVSTLRADKLCPSKLQEVKQAAFSLIEGLDGQGGWKRKRAEERLRFAGDDSELKALYEKAEVIRAASGVLEGKLVSMTYEQLISLDITTELVG
jgi:hypothetical protein